MRKIVMLTAVVAALVGAGMAVAHHNGTKSITAVSATFGPTTASSVKTSTCTGADGTTYASTKATYTGPAVSTDTNLNGTATFRTEALINTKTNVGTISGRFKIEGKNTEGEFAGVYSNGNFAGLASGHTDDHSRLLGNISAAFATATGFTGGKLGGATTGGDAVLIAKGGCEPVPAPKPDKVEAHGAVSAITDTSITAAGVTCAIPPELTSAVKNLDLKTGSQVDMTCTVASTGNTLTKISKRGGKHDDDDHNEKSSKH